MCDEQALGELEEQRLLGHLGGRAQVVQLHHCPPQPVERIADGGHPPDTGDGLAHLLFEQREQELVLAVEVLVEAAQRLLRPVDDLLDRELGRALLVDDLAGRVQELLHADGGALAGRASGPFDRSITPDGVAIGTVVAWIGSIVDGNTGRHPATLAFRKSESRDPGVPLRPILRIGEADFQDATCQSSAVKSTWIVFRPRRKNVGRYS